MGIFFTLLYIFTSYLAPSTVFGDLAQYHLEEFIAFVALIASLLKAQGAGVFKMSQTVAVLALMVCVVLSLVFNGVTRSAPEALITFLTGALTYFFIMWNFRTWFHVQLLIAVLLAAALFVVSQGFFAVNTGNVASPWVFVMGHVGDNVLLRIRGLGFINDPNDLCQFLVGLIPCVFIFWRRGNFLRNLLFVLLPVFVLLYGMFLTHSRGGMVGLLAALMVVGWRKFGVIPAVITGGGLFVALSAIGWSGGRDVSAESGSDRMEAWSTGLTLIRSHPVFGVGYHRFEEYFYITAHNTVVVCAAEIGLVGFFFWTLMVIPTMVELGAGSRAASPKLDPDAARKVRPPFPWARAAAATSPLTIAPTRMLHTAAALRLRATPALSTVISASLAQAIIPTPPVFLSRGPILPVENSPKFPADEEIRRMCSLLTISLTGFFAAGWFLSRSYTTVLFVNIAMALAIHRLAVERGIVPGYLAWPKAAKYSGIATVVLIALVYILLRVTNLLPK